jgi:peptidoglycan/xylan/chitin deacetylase (PgdA/CDA1 family)
MSIARLSFVLAASLAVGTWLGVGRPTADEAREQARRLADRARASLVPPAPSIPTQAPTDERPVEFGPLPQQRDPESVPGAGPWPSLNPDASIARAWMVAEGPAHAPGDGRRLVTFTFDDGPFLETTPSVLKVLRHYRIHATFFVIGEYLEGNDKRAAATRRLLKRVADAGHLVGNHSFDHAHLAQISHTRVLDQMDRCSNAIEKSIGKRPILFRPPFGELDDFGERAAAERRLDVMLWNVEVNDMNREDPHEMAHEIEWQLEYKEGGVVLLHDIRFSSIQALREVLAWMATRRWDPKRPSRVGYDIVDLPTYLQAVAASPQPYASREELDKARDTAAKLRRR